MYYPYLRGKQFELILIRDNAAFLAVNNINPIIEPVKEDFAALKRAMNELDKEGVACTLIVNPQVGQEPVQTPVILKELIEDTFKDYSKVALGFILHAKSNLIELTKLLKEYPQFNFSILHYGYTNGKKLADAIDKYKKI